MDVVWRKLVQDEDATARKEGAVESERGVLGGRGDKGDGAGFDDREELRGRKGSQAESAKEEE